MAYFKNLTKQAVKDFPVSLIQDAIKYVIGLILFTILIPYLSTKVFPKLSKHISNIINSKLFTERNVTSDTTKTKFIESPYYAYENNGIENQKSSFINNDQDFILVLLLFVFFNITIINFLHKNIGLAEKIMFIYAVIPIFPIIIIAFKSAISKVVQEISVKYVIVSIITSITTGVFAKSLNNLLPYLSTNNIQNISYSMTRLSGLFIIIIQHLISYVILIRVICVFIDRKSNKNFVLVRKILVNTNGFERLGQTMFLILFYIILSYLLATGKLVDFFSNLENNSELVKSEFLV